MVKVDVVLDHNLQIDHFVLTHHVKVDYVVMMVLNFAMMCYNDLKMQYYYYYDDDDVDYVDEYDDDDDYNVYHYFDLN